MRNFEVAAGICVTKSRSNTEREWVVRRALSVCGSRLKIEKPSVRKRRSRNNVDISIAFGRR